ncbi:hypothetical protein E4U55_006042 [Claviceps digitariae]|nr:hypothetical protein E4U55_006042 [Claviceps digitariae]
MLSIKKLLFLAVAVTSAVVPRDGKLEDLQLVTQDLQALTSAVEAYNGGDAQPIKSALVKYATDANLTLVNAKIKGEFSVDVSSQIIDYVRTTMVPALKKFLSAVDAKKLVFEANGLVDDVQAGLVALRAQTDSLSRTLVSKIPFDKISEVVNIIKDYQASFSAAISVFSSASLGI